MHQRARTSAIQMCSPIRRIANARTKDEKVKIAHEIIYIQKENEKRKQTKNVKQTKKI